MLNVYETIKTFGLCETLADLPIPDDDELRDRIVREAFEGFLGGLQGTGLHGEIEPLAHGLATLFHRRKLAMATALERATDTIRGLIRAADGSEVLEMQMEEAQRDAERARDRLDALEVIAEAAARCYEIETGRAYLPPAGGRRGTDARKTGALFEARAWIEAHEKSEAARFRVEGRPLAVAGTGTGSIMRGFGTFSTAAARATARPMARRRSSTIRATGRGSMRSRRPGRGRGRCRRWCFVRTGALLASARGSGRSTTCSQRRSGSAVW